MIGLDNSLGPFPALDDRERRAVVVAYLRGTPAAELARAYGVSVRTVYRYLEPIRLARRRYRWLELAERVVAGGKR